MRFTVKKLARESVGKAHAKNQDNYTCKRAFFYQMNLPKENMYA